MGWPKSYLVPSCHPHVAEIEQEVNDYFIRHWDFSSEKSCKKFLGAGFPRATCMCFPLSKNDRMSFACRLLTVLFLIDGKVQP